VKPVGGRIVHKSEEGIGVLGQAIDRFKILGLVLLLESSQLFQSRFPAFGPHDFVQMGFYPRWMPFWKLVEHVSDFVYPAMRIPAKTITYSG
jgi:hypothetical protein